MNSEEIRSYFSLLLRYHRFLRGKKNLDLLTQHEHQFLEILWQRVGRGRNPGPRIGSYSQLIEFQNKILDIQPYCAYPFLDMGIVGLKRLQERIKNTGLEICCARYGINYKRHKEYPNLVLLKYDQIKGKMGSEMVQAARGLILDENNNWKVVSYPFNKFFNYGEAHVPKKFDWENCIYQEKLDGSLMILYWYDDAWHVSTSGTPDASGPVPGSAISSFKEDKPESFAEYFWNTWRKEYELKEGETFFPKSKDFCYMFELTGLFNQVVVKQIKSKLTFLGARNLKSYAEFHPQDLKVLNFLKKDEDTYIRPVKVFPINFGNDPQLVSKVILKPMDGSLQEGFVVVDQKFRRIKMKSEDYIRKHHLKGNNPTLKRLIAVYISGESSEWLTHFPEYKEIFNKIDKTINILIEEINVTYSSICNIESDKEFAEHAISSNFSKVLFDFRRKKISSIKEGVFGLNIDQITKYVENHIDNNS